MTTNQQPPLNSDQAYATLHQRVYIPAFFEKLARDYQWQPSSEEEAYQALTMAAQLRQAYDDNQEKQAQANGSLLGKAHNHLNNMLQKSGYDVESFSQDSQQIKQAAANGSYDPELARAVLMLYAGDVKPELLAGAN